MADVKSTDEGVLLPWAYLKSIRNPKMILADVMMQIMKKVISEDKDTPFDLDEMLRGMPGNGNPFSKPDPKQVFKV